MKNTNELGLLGIVFVALKLTDVIDWSWWYVTMPFWGVSVIISLLAIIHATREYFKPKPSAYDEMMEELYKPKKKSKFQSRLDEMTRQRDNNRN
jgi:hypothetical protein